MKRVFLVAVRTMPEGIPLGVAHVLEPLPRPVWQ